MALPAMTEERIRLGHGGGGTLMQELIDREFRRLYSDPDLLLKASAPAGRSRVAASCSSRPGSL